MNKKLAFVIPAYNEAISIGTAIEDIKDNFPDSDVFVVDDGSTDKTTKLSLEKGAIVFRHPINRGLGAALSTGIQGALKHNSDIIVTFDADLQHLGKDVRILIQPILDGEADAVIGSRFIIKEDLKDMPRTKLVGNKALTKITNILSGTNITDSQSGLRAFDKKAAEAIVILCDNYEVSSEIIHELAKQDMVIKEVPIKAIYDEWTKIKGTNVRSGLHIFWSMLLKKLGVKK